MCAVVLLRKHNSFRVTVNKIVVLNVYSKLMQRYAHVAPLASMVMTRVSRLHQTLSMMCIATGVICHDCVYVCVTLFGLVIDHVSEMPGPIKGWPCTGRTWVTRPTEAVTITVVSDVLPLV